jgi:hypothetical protein
VWYRFGQVPVILTGPSGAKLDCCSRSTVYLEHRPACIYVKVFMAPIPTAALGHLETLHSRKPRLRSMGLEASPGDVFKVCVKSSELKVQWLPCGLSLCTLGELCVGLPQTSWHKGSPDSPVALPADEVTTQTMPRFILASSTVLEDAGAALAQCKWTCRIPDAQDVLRPRKWLVTEPV